MSILNLLNRKKQSTFLKIGLLVLNLLPLKSWLNLEQENDD